jgi:RNA polymerase sigma-70 factor (ECF subfamily)
MDETPEQPSQQPVDASPAASSSASTALESTFDLLELARGGDAQAVERLFARYLPRLQRWARGRLPSGARRLLETDDLVQDVLLRTIRRVDTFEVRAGAGFHSYLRQACVNRIRDEIRRLGRTPDMNELDGEEPDPGPTPWDAALSREQRDRYEAALGQLRPDDREAVIARLELGCSYEEVAQALGKPSVNAGRMTVLRAIDRLIRLMSAADSADQAAREGTDHAAGPGAERHPPPAGHGA